jgi:uncharacterized sodium:solute symporter family permease YidK
MILGIPVYGLCLWLMPDIAFLHHMSITFVVLILYMSVITLIKPLKKPRVLPVRKNVDLKIYPSIKLWGGAVVILTVLLYIIFF